ncbi:hypothetical protein ACQZ6S_05725 [Agrobacterium tumefaciens]
MKLVLDNWQRVLFAFVGLICLYYSFQFLQERDVPSASAVFAVAFLSFIYSNLSRFKRFKGLGFEAELWEDKQKEAADLIDRLKKVVSIYTTEVVLSSVKRGRLSDGVRWKENWKLYDDLVTQHAELGQNIDFSNLKKEVDDFFLFDITMNIYKSLDNSFSKATSEARSNISKEFGSPVRDVEGFNLKHEQLRDAAFKLDKLFEIAKTQNLAKLVNERAVSCASKFKANFGLDVELDEALMTRLAAVSAIYDSRPVEVTTELIEWANRSG